MIMSLLMGFLAGDFFQQCVQVCHSGAGLGLGDLLMDA